MTLDLNVLEKIRTAVNNGYRKTVNLLFHGKDVDPNEHYDDVYGRDGSVTVAAMAGSMVRKIAPGVYVDNDNKVWVYNHNLNAKETFMLLIALNSVQDEEIRKRIAEIIVGEEEEEEEEDDP